MRQGGREREGWMEGGGREEEREGGRQRERGGREGDREREDNIK